MGGFEFRWPFPKQNQPHRIWSICSYLVLKLGVIYSKTMLNVFNSVTIHNQNILENVLVKIGTKPIITFSNHYSCMDDPVLWGMLPWNKLSPHKIRWALGAYDILFTTYRHQILFSLGKVIPIVRGDGVYQRGVDFCIEQINKNSWIHIFPEGRVNTEKEYLPFKWGIGRIISECDIVPIVLPFFHLGMDKILPNKRPYIPRIGHVEMRKRITDYLQNEFFQFRRQIESSLKKEE
ncbi:tafazzin-like isoform X2 [Gordionus sp. m RMFG-2023]|uniref:tafazzin-like isoform X2 n=1 Tax=Gordionus sp. m RMFG-2023 TaxID=3053472 RepID=UPI0031FCAC57